MEAEAERTNTDSPKKGMEVEPGGKDVDGLKRTVGTMRLLITFFLILHFPLACFVAAEFFHI
jgi:hypothetical protein